MNVIEALQWANVKLKSIPQDQNKNKTKTDSSMLDAELILSHSLHISRTELFSNLNRILTKQEQDDFGKLLNRRLNNEPIAYLIGKKEFYKRSFIVTGDVLIPRPATETLIEQALETINETDMSHDSILFADIGTGSGAIAVTLACETSIPVIASDINKTSLEIAKQNAQKHGVIDIVDFKEGNLAEPIIRLFKQLQKTNTVIKHLIICANLPYLSMKQMENAQPDILHEPEQALISGIDGLDAYFELFKQLYENRNTFPNKLTTIIEIDPSQSKSIISLIKHRFQSAEIEIKKDLEGHNRIVTAII
ncbi:MAG: peptide chain release factor N(5)-glutamine methyltransferase [Patescibacteria group bacterium]